MFRLNVLTQPDSSEISSDKLVKHDTPQGSDSIYYHSPQDDNLMWL